MPTTMARRAFMPLAIQYFLRQDYPGAELLILDDSRDPLERLWPEDSNIRYHHDLGPYSSLGAKRNYACSLAAGDFILHLDDDDWYAPDWISRQMQVLTTQNADLCGLSEVNFFSPAGNLGWLYVYPDHNRPWVAGATMAYRKSLWERNPFPDVQVGEDNHFVWSPAVRKVVAHDYTAGFVSILHDQNTSPKYTSDRRWQPRPAAAMIALLGADAQNY